MKTLSIHEETLAVMQSNNWDYAYAAGYVHGKDDNANNRQRDIPTSANDDYAKGYSKGFAHLISNN